MTRDELRKHLRSIDAATLYRDNNRHRYAKHVGWYDTDVVGETPAVPAAGMQNESTHEKERFMYNEDPGYGQYLEDLAAQEAYEAAHAAEAEALAEQEAREAEQRLDLDEAAQLILEARQRREAAQAEYDAIMEAAQEEAAAYKEVMDEAKQIERNVRNEVEGELLSAYEASGEKTHGAFQVRSRTTVEVHDKERAFAILENAERNTDYTLIKRKVDKRGVRKWLEAMRDAGYPVDEDVISLETSHSVAFYENRVDA